MDQCDSGQANLPVVTQCVDEIARYRFRVQDEDRVVLTARLLRSTGVSVCRDLPRFRMAWLALTRPNATAITPRFGPPGRRAGRRSTRSCAALQPTHGWSPPSPRSSPPANTDDVTRSAVGRPCRRRTFARHGASGFCATEGDAARVRLLCTAAALGSEDASVRDRHSIRVSYGGTH
jgi:hypothetical protein